MPRPPIHNTADAKAKAAREKHKRYYAKYVTLLFIYVDGS